MNTSTFLLAFVILGEFVEILDAYKLVRPYKFYHSRPWHRPRWHSFSKPLKYHHLQKRPSSYHHQRKPSHTRYLPQYENSVDYAADEQPYTIEIELPKRQSEIHEDRIYHRDFDRGTVKDYAEEDDYLEDDDDVRDRVIRAGKKRVRIKVIKGPKPRLNIKISRDDSEIDQANVSCVNSLRKPEISTNLRELAEPLEKEWIPSNPCPSFPEHLRGA